MLIQVVFAETWLWLSVYNLNGDTFSMLSSDLKKGGCHMSKIV